MPKKNYIVFFCFILSLSVGFAQEQNINDSLNARIQKVENGLRLLVHAKGDKTWNIEARMEQYNIPRIGIAVIDNYKIDWSKSYGTIGDSAHSNINNETVFQAASISKFVNAIAVLKLKELYDISLDEDINSYLSSWTFPYNAKVAEMPITLRQILTHRAGLSTHGFDGYKSPESLPEITEILEGKSPANSEKVKQLMPPNQEFKYSGGGTMISQVIVSDISKQNYAAFIEQYIFEPLKMQDSFYSTEIEKYNANMAHGQNDDGEILKNRFNYYPELAAAGLWSTPTDLAGLIIDFQKSLNDGSGIVLSKISGREMSEPAMEGEITGLGLFLENENGVQYLQHSGSNKGFRSKCYFSADLGTGVVVMTNGRNIQIMDEIIRSVADAYNWKGWERLESASDMSITEAELKSYSGTYHFDRRKIIITVENGKLQATEKKKWRSGLTPLSASAFIIDIVKPQSTMEFVKDERGIVTKFIIEQGERFEWIKQK